MPKPKRFKRWSAVVRGPHHCTREQATHKRRAQWVGTRTIADHWPEVATLGAYAVRVLPWPNYTDDGARWWTCWLTGEGRRYWLGFNGTRFAECFALSRLRRQAPELELQALEALKKCLGSSGRVPLCGYVAT